MAKRKITILDRDEILRKHCRVVTKFDGRLWELLEDMAETMYDANGAGLAAPQVSVLKRVVVIDVNDDHGLIEMINPEIIATEGSEIAPESCLSVPGRCCTVDRPTKVTVRAQDRNGETFEITGEGFLAKAMCHEIDHLDGVLYVDKMVEDVSDRYRMVGGQD